MTGIYERLLKAECDEYAHALLTQKLSAAQPIIITAIAGASGDTRTYIVTSDGKVQPAE